MNITKEKLTAALADWERQARAEAWPHRPEDSVEEIAQAGAALLWELLETVYIIRTEAGDEYLFDGDGKPTQEQAAKRIWELEGGCADLEFYLDTVTVIAQKVGARKQPKC